MDLLGVFLLALIGGLLVGAALRREYEARARKAQGWDRLRAAVEADPSQEAGA